MDKLEKLEALYKINKQLLKEQAKMIRILKRKPPKDLNKTVSTAIEAMNVSVRVHQLNVEKHLIIAAPVKKEYAIGGILTQNESNSENITHKAPGDREEIVNTREEKTE